MEITSASVSMKLRHPHSRDIASPQAKGSVMKTVRQKSSDDKQIHDSIIRVKITDCQWRTYRPATPTALHLDLDQKSLNRVDFRWPLSIFL
ncbi:hypothetical protein DIT71_09795 [Marinobacter vulgaris]|uniref:Uncharacterized protein n=1 Tax=Marinobacter vulgaris TaxID=1928331 RepID=A0A2V3ZN43_9GAMM|nr:hypothetical protein DIT71_09795 [Marinobacter vulgaris]